MTAAHLPRIGHGVSPCEPSRGGWRRSPRGVVGIRMLCMAWSGNALCAASRVAPDHRCRCGSTQAACSAVAAKPAGDIGCRAVRDRPVTTRTGAMVAARRADSHTKRARVLAAIDQLVAEAAPVTVAAVARRAKVSTWLVYTPELREAITAARARRTDTTSGAPAAAAAVATDLALARAEIGRLRAERDRQDHQLRRSLGARVEQLAKADLVERVDELTAYSRQLASQLTAANAEGRQLQARVAELEDDLTAARASLRRVIRAENLPAATAPSRPQGVSR